MTNESILQKTEQLAADMISAAQAENRYQELRRTYYWRRMPEFSVFGHRLKHLCTVADSLGLDHLVEYDENGFRIESIYLNGKTYSA